MSHLQTVGTIVLGVCIVAGLGWLLWQAMRNSETPGLIIGRWLATAVILGGAFKLAMPMIRTGASFAVVAGVLIIAAAAICVGLIWAPSWANMLSSSVTNMWDGGNEEPEPAPVYSSAQATKDNIVKRCRIFTNNWRNFRMTWPGNFFSRKSRPNI